MGKPEISTTEKQRFQQKLKICIFYVFLPQWQTVIYTGEREEELL